MRVDQKTEIDEAARRSFRENNAPCGSHRSGSFLSANAPKLTGKAGFGTLSTLPVDVDQTVAFGLSAADQRQIAEDNGVKLSYVDLLTCWVPDWTPVNEDPDILPYLERSQVSFLRVADEQQVDKIRLIGTCPASRYSIDELCENEWNVGSGSRAIVLSFGSALLGTEETAQTVAPIRDGPMLATGKGPSAQRLARRTAGPSPAISLRCRPMRSPHRRGALW